MVNINLEKLRDLFSYHPPVDSDRELKHEAINEAAVDFALAIAEVIDNPAELTTILRKIQEVRMLANQAIVLDSENLSYRGIFEDDHQ